MRNHSKRGNSGTGDASTWVTGRFYVNNPKRINWIGFTDDALAIPKS